MKKYVLYGLILIFSQGRLHGTQDEAMTILTQLEAEWLSLEQELESLLRQEQTDTIEKHETLLTQKQESLEAEIENVEAIIAQFIAEERLAEEARKEADRAEQEAVSRHLALPRRSISRGKRAAAKKVVANRKTETKLDRHSKQKSPIIEHVPSKTLRQPQQNTPKSKKAGAIPRHRNSVKALQEELRRKEMLRRRSQR